MPLRRRLALVAAAAVAVAILLVSLVSYLVVRGQLRGQEDGALKGQSILVQRIGIRGFEQANLPGLAPSAGGRAPYAQVVSADGSVLLSTGGISLPVDTSTRQAARGRVASDLEDARVHGIHLRVLTFSGEGLLPGGQVVSVAVQLARPLAQVDHVLANLRLMLALLCAGGIALAAALGRLAARRVLAPLADVTRTAEHIGQTDDLSLRIAVRADDEVGQLATRFNQMIERLEGSRAALDASVAAQRQLVADASHELRTPVTSLRTNIEVLLEGGDLSEEDRRRLLRDVVDQSEELSSLVSDLIELGRGEERSDAVEYVRLDRVVAESVARGRRNVPGVKFEATLAPVLVEVVPERLGRAVNNLIDNAARHSKPGGTVEVVVDPGGVLVRDHGPGIPVGDLPFVFDRFFRGENARRRQGSGLGLAIVRQFAEQHGGSVTAANAPEGGALFRLALPPCPDQRPGEQGPAEDRAEQGHRDGGDGTERMTGRGGEAETVEVK